ncbi:MAG TPA: VOC family protein [Chitinophagaceae bacterium]|jgi:catechol 2,3-dioxygenase-like lactoylglutathione lyase family enzyme|nr:VOC family protein [Chitinophagaceae bacterium]
MKRRKFIELSASAGIFSLINAHNLLGTNAVKTVKKNLISSLRLETHSSLSEMRNFYEKVIGFPVVSETQRELIIRAGQTKLVFVKTTQGSRPFYHFAFNIPENKIYKAFEWQKKRTALINPRPTNERDPMKEVVNFQHWNSHSIFFLDPAGNLLEYIARHDLKNPAEGDFSVNDILYASEIGLVVDDTKSSGDTIIRQYEMDWYRPAANGYWVVGDEYGLLLMTTPGMIWTGHTGQENKTAVFKTSVTINSAVREEWRPDKYPYEIVPV